MHYNSSHHAVANEQLIKDLYTVIHEKLNTSQLRSTYTHTQYIALTDCGPDWLSFTNLLDNLPVILTGLIVEIS